MQARTLWSDHAKGFVAKATGDLIGNKIADKITKVPRSLLQNNKEMINNDNELLQERYVLPKERQEIIDVLMIWD